MSEFHDGVSPLQSDALNGRDALAEGLLAAASLMDPSAIATLTVKHVRDLCGADGAALYWWDEAEQVLLPLAVLDPRASRLHQVFHPGQGATGEAFATNTAVVANNYPGTLAFPPAWKVAEEVKAVAAVPLVTNGQVCGVLTITQHHEADVTERDVEVMRVVGEQVAPTLQGMRALAHAQFRLAEARELTSLIRDAATSDDVGQLLERICVLSCRLLGAEFAGVVLIRDSENTWSAAYGNVSDSAAWPTEVPQWPLLPRLIDGEPFLLSHLGDNPDWPLRAMPVIAAENLHTALAVPLIAADGSLLGGLILGWRFDLEPSAQLVGLARTLGASATSLLTQARTMAALREGEQLWRLTMDNAPVGICLLRLDGRFQLVNAAMSRILGYSEDDLLSRDFASITFPGHLEEKQALLSRLVAGEPAVGTIQTRCLHADGHGVWTSVSVQLVRDLTGAPEFFSAQIEDISAQHEHTEQLTYLATHDSLTGLANRRQFYDVLSPRLEQGWPTVVALVDVPELRGLDDRFGHLTAGEVIREVAARLAGAPRPDGSDGDVEAEAEVAECVARFAADEFAAMLVPQPGVSTEQMVTERLLAAFREPVIIGDRSHILAAYIGVAVANPGSGAQEVLRAADTALMSARRDGRTLLEYTPAMGQAESHRRRLILDLRTALADGSLSMVFQPIIAATTGVLTAAEGLARWIHPEFGPIGPDVFIPLAEDSGLMSTLTAWALDAAVGACARWQREKPGVAVSVNLSASDLQNPPTIALIETTLSRHGLPAGLLNVELTETTVMTDLGIALEMLNELSHLGIGLAIDDFGTGYSSLAYLRRLPMMVLKIDRSFVTTMLADPGNAVIVTMIIELALALGRTTIAEGVEDAATGERLAALRCDRLQGYGIARPMSEADFVGWNP